MERWDDSVVPELSVVVPCFDEADCIEPLLREILAAIEPTGLGCELIVVDDASKDSTPQVLERLTATFPMLRPIRHSRNSGQSAALATGFHAARGAIVVTLDGDGQNDPASIPDLLARLSDCDAVTGIRTRRRDSWVRRASSRIGNGFRRFVTRDQTVDAGCNLRAMKREALAELPMFNGMHRFLPTLLRYQGWSVAEIPVKHRPRTAGCSKYGIRNRAFRGVADCFAMLWLRRRLLQGRRVARTETPAACEK